MPSGREAFGPAGPSTWHGASYEYWARLVAYLIEHPGGHYVAGCSRCNLAPGGCDKCVPWKAARTIQRLEAMAKAKAKAKTKARPKAKAR